ncbi:MAG: ArsR/SmtB family transcription factor [Fimbriimonas sp.]
MQKALSEPKRLEIVEVIRRLDSGEGVACSAVLAEINVAQSTFSHHVSELADSGVITGNKSGRFFLLSLNEPVVKAYIETLTAKILQQK